MKLLKYIFKWLGALIIIPIIYVALSLILILIPINSKNDYVNKNKSIYLQTNGVHLTIILARNQMHSTLFTDLVHNDSDKYFAFGWGDKNFYLTTPTWNDLTVKNALYALFVKSDALMHVIRYKHSHSDWTEIRVNQKQLNAINEYIKSSFLSDAQHHKFELAGKGYGSNDDFYEAVGSFSCLKTCNTWVNSCLKTSDVKCLIWTPFDFGLIHLFKE